MLQEPIKIQHSHKGTAPPRKMDRSTVHKLIGSNKLTANKEKKYGFNNNIIGIPKNGTTQNTINCNFGLPNCCNQKIKNYCQYWIAWLNQEKEYQIEQ